MSTDRRGPRLTRHDLAAGVKVALVACLLGAIALEGVTRVVFDRNGMHFGLEMWKYAKWVKRQSANPAMGHEHAPGREARLMGVLVRTNSLGLRDREFVVPKPAGVHRILVLGDSMTFGWGANEEDTYPKVLERLLNAQGSGARYEVINAGVGNYNTAQEVAYFRERGLQLQPDEVILGFFINDAEATPRPDDSPLKRHLYSYVVASSLWDAVARRAGLKPTLAEYYEGLYSSDNPGWQALDVALRALAQTCRDRGITLTIALIPELHQPDDRYPFRQAHVRVAQVAREEAVPTIDLLPAFAGVTPRSLWVSAGDAHPNARGHEIIGRALFTARAGRDQE